MVFPFVRRLNRRGVVNEKVIREWLSDPQLVKPYSQSGFCGQLCYVSARQIWFKLNPTARPLSAPAYTLRKVQFSMYKNFDDNGKRKVRSAPQKNIPAIVAAPSHPARIDWNSRKKQFPRSRRPEVKRVGRTTKSGLF